SPRMPPEATAFSRRSTGEWKNQAQARFDPFDRGPVSAWNAQPGTSDIPPVQKADRRRFTDTMALLHTSA
ncbi:hypothetical protein MKK70_00900, partial [Methylobacterium sp. E-041]|uniref:hypothetical protein n=1 Tax=Methylobacterium sp. E-041 TaxID=2836573 RepID=UPI001FBA2982